MHTRPFPVPLLSRTSFWFSVQGWFRSRRSILVLLHIHLPVYNSIISSSVMRIRAGNGSGGHHFPATVSHKVLFGFQPPGLPLLPGLLRQTPKLTPSSSWLQPKFFKWLNTLNKASCLRFWATPCYLPGIGPSKVLYSPKRGCAIKQLPSAVQACCSQPNQPLEGIPRTPVL